MSLTSAPVVPCSCAEGWKPEGWAFCAGCYEGQIERLGCRITVLEMVIRLDLHPSDCSDELNEMVVQDIIDRYSTGATADASTDSGAPAK